MRRRLPILTAALAAALASAGSAGATTFYLSTLGGPVVPSLPTSRGGDIVEYDDVANTTTIFFSEDLFTAQEEIDALELLPNSHMLLSTASSASLGGISFVNGDIVEYDPVADLATLIFEEQPHFQGQADVDAVAMLPNGNLLFSTEGNATLTLVSGNMSVGGGDIIEWNLATDTFVGVFFSHSADIDAFDVTDDGRYAFSTTVDSSIADLPFFTDSDLVLYDPFLDTAIIWIPESFFGDPANSPLDAIAVTVPEPSAFGLLALGLVGLAIVGRRS